MKINAWARFAGVILCVSSLSVLAVEQEQMQFKLLPRERAFQLTFADPREIRMALQFEGGSRLTAAVGNYFSLLGWETPENYDEDTPARKLCFGFEGAGYFGLRQYENRFPLETADGLIGAYLEGSHGPWQAQLRYTHISAHLADGSDGTPIPYSREFLALRLGYVPFANAFLYGGISSLVNSVPPLPAMGVQWGAQVFLPISSFFAVPFAAADFKWKRESPKNPSMNFQIGIGLNDPPEAYRSFRIFYSYFSGSDPRGQYYFNDFQSHALGIEMQI